MSSNIFEKKYDASLMAHEPVVSLPFEEFYHRYWPRIYSICLRMTRSTADAEDLTQEAIIHAFGHRADFRGRSAFTSWLHRLTVTQVLIYFRKKSVNCERTTESGILPEASQMFSGRPLAGNIIDRIALAAAIKALAPGHRAVFLLYDVEGYEHNEVALILNISVGTSKSQLHKARLRLRALLREQC